MPDIKSHLTEFFDNFTLSEAIQLTNTIFAAASSNKAWRSNNPFEAVHFCQQLQLLSKAAFRFCKETGEIPTRRKGQVSKKTKPTDEYEHAMRALNCYCLHRSKKYWKRLYELLLRCCLSTDSLQQYLNRRKLMAFRSQICSLIDGCYIMLVFAAEARRSERQR